MKKIIILTGAIWFFNQTFAGGLLTIGNQSAQYIRMLSRNASTSIDAVYYNPAGLMLMDNGFYISVHNQSIFQTKSIESGFPLLNNSKFEGKLAMPIFPSAFAVYKKEKFALSLGFGPNGGGASGEFGNGLPSFDKSISTLPVKLSGLNKIGMKVDGYSSDFYFKGESHNWGMQGGASVKINNVFSVYGGLRYVLAKSRYQGHLSNIAVRVNGEFKNAAAFLGTEVPGILHGMSAQATGAAVSVQPLILLGGGGYTLAQVQRFNYISLEQRTALEQGLIKLAGKTQSEVDQMSVSAIQATFNAGAAAINGQADIMTATAGQLHDKLVESSQTGAGITPIIGLDIKPIENLNIGIKYEFMTKMTLTNKTKVDDTGLFTDAKKTVRDIPAIFSVGADYKISKLTLSGSFNHYYDKGVDWGMNIYNEPRVIDHNAWEVAVGTQYQLTNILAVSCGYLRTSMGVYPQFQSDFSYYNNVINSFGGGFEIKLTPNFNVDAGAIVSNAKDATKPFVDRTYGNYSETYSKHNLGFALGLGYKF